MFHFLDVDERKLKNVNKGGHKANKHVELQAMNAFEKWRKFCGHDVERSITYWFENEEVVMKPMDMLFLFVFEIVKKVGNLYPPTKCEF